MPLTFNNPEYLFILLFIPVMWFLLHRITPLSKGRVLLTGIVRSLLIILLSLTLSDPQITKNSDEVNVLFCLDRSDSIRGEDKAFEFINKSTQAMGEEDKAGLIIFGKSASMETGLMNPFNPGSIRSEINNQFTNIYDTLQTAIGRFPESGDKRIVLLSDGNQNIKHAEEMANLAASMGIEIWVIPLETWFEKNEIHMEKFEIPAKINLHTPFNIQLSITGTDQTQGELLIKKNNTLFVSRHVTLNQGKNIFEFTDTHEESGLYLYKAVINPEKDTVYKNNEIMAFSEGSQKSHILYIADQSKQDSYLINALKVQGFDPDIKSPMDFPDSIHMLINYNAIILDNVSATSLPLSAMMNIEKYVKDTGGGLVMIGGSSSFGAGFYLKTPVEKALPVFMDRPTTAEMPSLCLVLVLDKSSSMSGHIKNNIKLEGAKIASFSAVELLSPNDRIGVLAFDMEYQWIVPLRKANNRELIAKELTMLKADGGTNLYPGLVEVYDKIKKTDALKKHIIVLSDGQTDTANFEPLLSAMKKDNISLSAVAVGDGSDTVLMKNIARWGSGRYYYTDDADNIPRIFTGETQIVAKNTILEKKMSPVALSASEILGGIPQETLPDIHGMVATYPKPGSQVIIKTEEGPLLASWNYGLGRSAVFTSDLHARWSREWVTWNYYEKFVSQLIKWVQKKRTGNTLDVSMSRNGEECTFTADALDHNGFFVNNLELEMKVLLPSGQDRIIKLKQSAPGRYQGFFPASQTGEYYISLYSPEKDRFRETQTFGYSIPYSDEYKTRSINHTLLTKLSKTTGGSVLKLGEPSETLFKAHKKNSTMGKKIWPHLTILFLFLFIVDVAMRKYFRIVNEIN